ncbi:hypothetical protein DOY81_001726, partial [Sarcophaga bullata]
MLCCYGKAAGIYTCGERARIYKYSLAGEMFTNIFLFIFLF